MRYAETLFLINDGKPQRMKFHIFLDDSVCPDDDVNLAFFQISKNFLLFLRRSETRKHLDSDRHLVESLERGSVML